MRLIINLIDPARSEVEYSYFKFNDGEPHYVLSDLDRKKSYTVVTRIASPEDLFGLLQVGDVLDRQGVTYDIKLSYLMGMRMDRVMHFSEPFTLRIVGQVLSSLNYDKLSVLEPHSDRTLTEIPRSNKLVNPMHILFLNAISGGALPVFPDAGAAERYASLVENNFVVGSKIRDAHTGSILSLNVSQPYLIKGAESIAVIDDLCDGGGTFAMLASAINKINPEVKKTIFITHVVNARGIEVLSSNYNNVIITNSYKAWDNLPDNVSVSTIL